MGGIGSGRPPSRPTLDQCKHLSLGRLGLRQSPLQRLIKLEWSDGSSVRLTVSGDRVSVQGHVSAHGISQSIKLTINLMWPPCALGGNRPYLACPTCENRSTKLYFWPDRFQCYRCTRLLYGSQTHDHVRSLDQTIRKAQQRIVGSKNDPTRYSYRDVPARPKHMRWRTYDRLTDRLVRLQDRQDELFLRSIGR